MWRQSCCCKGIGAELPEYELIGTTTLRVHFKALKRALIDESKAPNRHDGGLGVGLEVGLADKIMELAAANPEMTMAVMAEKLDVTKRTVEREIKKLREAGRIERIGGKRYGHWQIND